MKIIRQLTLLLAAALVLMGCDGNNTATARTRTLQGWDSQNYEQLTQVNIPKAVSNTVIKHDVITINFNTKQRIPNAVAYVLTAAMVAQSDAPGAEQRSNYKFFADPATRHSADWSDYKNSGYDRGHMAPAMDMRWDAEAMRQCFLMTNMVPQVHELNDGQWRGLEQTLHRWAEKLGALVIVTGHVPGHYREAIGPKRDIAVPELLFKVLLDPQRNMAIGFVFPNEKAYHSWRNYAVTVDEVERLTGFDFFAAMPPQVQKAVESHADLAQWDNAVKGKTHKQQGKDKHQKNKKKNKKNKKKHNNR